MTKDEKAKLRECNAMMAALTREQRDNLVIALTAERGKAFPKMDEQTTKAYNAFMALNGGK